MGSVRIVLLGTAQLFGPSRRLRHEVRFMLASGCARVAGRETGEVGGQISNPSSGKYLVQTVLSTGSKQSYLQCQSGCAPSAHVLRASRLESEFGGVTGVCQYASPVQTT